MGITAGASALLDAGALGGIDTAAAIGAADAGAGLAGGAAGFDAIGALGAGGGDALAAASDTAVSGAGGTLGPLADAFGGGGLAQLAGGLKVGGLGNVPVLGSSLGSGLSTGGLGLNAGGIATGAAPAVGGPGGLGGITDFLSANKSLILPGALEAGALLTHPKIPYEGNLQALANPSAGGTAAGGLASSLIPSVQTGNLPPGASTAVSNATQDSITSIKAKYAQMGLSGSTMEAQDIASAQARGQSMAFDLANQLTQTGLTAAGVSQQDLANQQNIYALLMNAQLQNDQQLSDALASFASASALGSALKG